MRHALKFFPATAVANRIAGVGVNGRNSGGVKAEISSPMRTTPPIGLKLIAGSWESSIVTEKSPDSFSVARAIPAASKMDNEPVATKMRRPVIIDVILYLALNKDIAVDSGEPLCHGRGGDMTI